MPPDEDHHFGHDKVGFLASGFEGGLVFLTGVTGLWQTARRSPADEAPEDLAVSGTLVDSSSS